MVKLLCRERNIAQHNVEFVVSLTLKNLSRNTEMKVSETRVEKHSVRQALYLSLLFFLPFFVSSTLCIDLVRVCGVNAARINIGFPPL